MPVANARYVDDRLSSREVHLPSSRPYGGDGDGDMLRFLESNFLKCTAYYEDTFLSNRQMGCEENEHYLMIDLLELSQCLHCWDLFHE